METEKTLNREALKELPKKNHTSFLVLKDLSERQRTRVETDMDRNAMKLLYRGFKVDPEQYMQVWKDLEELGAGVIVWGRNGNSNRFRWHYSLKDVGVGAVNPDSVTTINPAPHQENTVTPIKQKRTYTKRSKRGRPVGSKNRPKLSPPPSVSGITFTIFDVDGNTHNISLEEAVRIAESVAKLKELTKVA